MIKMNLWRVLVEAEKEWEEEEAIREEQGQDLDTQKYGGQDGLKGPVWAEETPIAITSATLPSLLPLLLTVGAVLASFLAGL